MKLAIGTLRQGHGGKSPHEAAAHEPRSRRRAPLWLLHGVRQTDPENSGTVRRTRRILHIQVRASPPRHQPCGRHTRRQDRVQPGRTKAETVSWVAGIDFSSNAIDVVHVHVDDLKPPIWNHYPLTGRDAFERTRTVGYVFPGRRSYVWDNVLAFGIEHPAGKFGTGAMMRVQGAVLACLPARVLVQPWPPAAWRKAVGLPGNASKADVASHARRTIWVDDPTENWPQDAFDAFCIALATRAAITSEKAA